MLALLLLFSQAWGLAPFYAQRETVDRQVNGQHQRSYLVIFNERAPSFGLVKEKLQSWLPAEMPELAPENVQWIYEITENFRGFAVWATPESMQSVLAYDFVKYVEEDQVMRIAAPFTSRADWGQVRGSQRARNLATAPTTQYSGSSYGNGGAESCNTTGCGGWDWTSAVKDGYRLINNGASARIFIVDTGVLSTHQEFQAAGKSRVVVTQDFASPTNGGADCNGHGTHCAGSAAGLYRGLATNAEIGNIRVLNCQGSGTSAGIVNGFNYVANNQAPGKTNILSASLGGGASQASDDAINAAASKGVIPVVAGGNSGANACNYSPARATGAITVGATAANDTLASFSNFGNCTNVLAPGVNIHSAWNTGTNAYNTISGTSMATPLVAGAIAVYATSRPSQPVTNAAVRSAISSSSTSGAISSLPAGTPNLLINSQWP